MRSRISAWIRDAEGDEALLDRRELLLMLAAGLVIAAGVGWGAEATGHLPPGVVVVAVGIVAIGGVVSDGFVGLGLGLLGAAILGGSQLVLNRHATDARGAYVATLVLIVLLGAVTGTASERMRRERRRQRRAEAMAVIPAGGSLGLLGLEDAQLRLIEELARARRYDRPLSVITLRVLTDPQALSPDEVRRIRRAVARTLESGLHSTDTPYVIDEETFGVMLPEASAETARKVADSLAVDAGNATFADRTTGGRPRVREAAELSMGISEVTGIEADGREQHAEALLIASREALQPVPTDDPVVRHSEQS